MGLFKITKNSILDIEDIRSLFVTRPRNVKPRLYLKRNHWHCTTGNRDTVIGTSPLNAWIAWAMFYGNADDKFRAMDLEFREVFSKNPNAFTYNRFT